MKSILNKTVLVVLFCILAFSVQAQRYKNNISDYKVPLMSGSSKLIESGAKLLTADSLQPYFKAKGYSPVNIKLGTMEITPLSPGEIYRKVSEATVIVSSAGKCNEINDQGKVCDRIHIYPASGYIISSEGIVVTNYHVANGYVTKYNKDSRNAWVVMLKDGTVLPVVELLSADKANDLAILKIDTQGLELPYLNIATKDAEIGDPVFIVSHPKGYFYSFSSGMVTDKFSEIKAGQYRNTMAISADFAAGSSGAAIIDQFGNVIGTVTYTKTLQHSDDASKTQMVLKATIPSAALLKLIQEGN